jgi:DNA transformation protein
MESDLLDLKNLGNTSVNWLRVIGVSSREDLITKGAAAAYLQIKHRGIRVSKTLLYALHGATIDTHWNDLSPSVKQSLLEQTVELEDNHESA